MVELGVVAESMALAGMAVYVRANTKEDLVDKPTRKAQMRLVRDMLPFSPTGWLRRRRERRAGTVAVETTIFRKGDKAA